MPKPRFQDTQLTECRSDATTDTLTITFNGQTATIPKQDIRDVPYMDYTDALKKNIAAQVQLANRTIDDADIDTFLKSVKFKVPG